MAQSQPSLEFEYEGILYPSMMTSTQMLDEVRKLPLSSDDILVPAYPKTGVVWLKYLLYMIMHDGDTDVDMRELLHLDYVMPGETPETAVKGFSERAPPRCFTTHLPFHFMKKQVLEDKVKTIVLMRNPKDTLVSFYHFYRMMKPLGQFSGTWDEFFQMAHKKKLAHGDFFDYNLGWWKVKDNDNVLMVRYEEMKEDLAGVVRKLAKFTGYELSDDMIQKIVHQGRFDQMNQNPRVNGELMYQMGMADPTKSKFMRKGQVGDSVNYFSKEQNEYIDKQCEERCTPLGLKF